MKLSSFIAATTAQLAEAGLATARLDTLVLIEDALERDRAWLLSHPEFELQGSVLKKLSTKVAQRVQHVPLAYIRGKAEFYGREFAVNEHTLVPRPETETMIDLLKQVTINDKRLTITDIGTGSGAIAITAKLEIPEATVIATDIDQNCLKVATRNAKRLSANIKLLHGNLLQPLYNLKTINYKLVLLCNLPYVPDDFQINTAATHEPRTALFGGTDGLDLYRKLFTQTAELSQKPQYILTESLPPQHEALAGIAKAAGYSCARTDDFIQLFTLV